MIVYHMSDTLPLHAEMTADYKKTMGLITPFLQALDRSQDCFFGMLLAAKHQKAVLAKFGLQDMWTNYTKWATEAIFEFVRRKEFPHFCDRINGHYFFDSLDSARTLYQVELDDDAPARLDMRLFDEAFDAMWDREDLETALSCARRYFPGRSLPGAHPGAAQRRKGRGRPGPDAPSPRLNPRKKSARLLSKETGGFFLQRNSAPTPLNSSTEIAWESPHLNPHRADAEGPDQDLPAGYPAGNRLLQGVHRLELPDLHPRRRRGDPDCRSLPAGIEHPQDHGLPVPGNLQPGNGNRPLHPEQPAPQGQVPAMDSRGADRQRMGKAVRLL